MTPQPFVANLKSCFKHFHVLTRLNLLALLVVLLVPAPGIADTSCANAVFDSVFYQPYRDEMTDGKDKQAGLKKQRFTNIGEQLRLSGIKNFYLQWTQTPQVDFVRSAPGEQNLIDAVLKVAKDNQITVYFGLYHDPAFFHLGGKDLLQVKAYLRQLRQKTKALAQEIVRRYGSKPYFKGFYITEEIDDLNWRYPIRQHILKQFLQDVRKDLRQLAPQKEVVISAFFAGNMAPRDYASLWQNILASVTIRVLFQDGIGAGLNTSDESRIYIEAFKQQLDLAQWSLIVEAFNLLSGKFNLEDTQHDSNKFARADINTLQRRIKYFRPLVKNRPMTLFSLRYLIEDDFFLLRQYRQYYCKSKSD